jgi:hypothetical protein
MRASISIPTEPVTGSGVLVTVTSFEDDCPYPCGADAMTSARTSNQRARSDPALLTNLGSIMAFHLRSRNALKLDRWGLCS